MVGVWIYWEVQADALLIGMKKCRRRDLGRCLKLWVEQLVNGKTGYGSETQQQ